MFVICELEVSGFLIASASCVVFWIRKRESLFPGASHFIRQMSSPWVNKICKPKERISQQDQLQPTKFLRSFILPQALVVKVFGSSLNLSIKQELAFCIQDVPYLYILRSFINSWSIFQTRKNCLCYEVSGSHLRNLSGNFHSELSIKH